MITHEVKAKIRDVVDQLNIIEKRFHLERGQTFPPDVWHVTERRKYYAVDYGTSGAFLIEKDTGELYNITTYGVADKNKKQKANLGNILTVNPEVLHSKRWNYLR